MFLKAKLDRANQLETIGENSTIARIDRERVGRVHSFALLRLPDSGRATCEVRKVPFSDFDVETSHGTARRHIGGLCCADRSFF